jgi:hypothetical protein
VGAYNIYEGVFDLPGAWSDQSVNVLSRTAGDGSRVGVVITRFAPPDGQTLEAYADQQLAQHSQTLRGYELLARRSSHVGKLPAVEVKIRWIDDRDAMFHHIAYVSYFGRLLIFTASSRASAQQDCERLVTQILESAKFRER